MEVIIYLFAAILALAFVFVLRLIVKELKAIRRIKRDIEVRYKMFKRNNN